MTLSPEQLSALDFALSHIENVPLAERDPAFYTHLAALQELLHHGQCEALAWDYSKAALVAFMRKHSITIPQSEFDQWRMVPLCEQRTGSINALPDMRGMLRATNGILCFLERSDGTLIEGHLEFFVPDAGQHPVRISHNGKPKKPTKAEAEDEILKGIFV